MRNMLKTIAGAATLFAGVSFAVSPALAEPPPGEATTAVEISDQDVFYGSADAPVTIVEFASLTCPHCMRFHTEVMPKLKEGVIGEGKVRLIYRDFPLDGLALRASALTRCGGPERRLAILDLLFESQPVWRNSKDPLTSLAQIGKLAGLKEETSRACMEDKGMFDQIIAEAQIGETQHGVRSTPTVIIGETRYGGGLTAEDITDIANQIAK
jgi:protein-disulfide isomerase